MSASRSHLRMAGFTSCSAAMSRDLKDTDGDGVADVFEVVNADWGISGDYHEYAF